MADSRIYNLPVNTDTTDFYFICDEGAQTSAQRLSVNYIKGLISANTDLATTNAEIITANTDDINTLYDKVDNLEKIISWATITPVSTDINTVSQLRACMINTVDVHITGRLRLDSNPAENTILYTLPSTFPTFTETIYFNAGDAGTGDDNIELKALSGTRDIVTGEQTSADATCSYNERLPII